MDFNTLELNDIAKLDRVCIEDKAKLPDIPAIYFVVQILRETESIKIIYIGKAQNLQRRWNTHEKTKVLRLMEGIHIFYLSLDIEFHQKIEWELIKKFKPVLNEINPQPNSVKECSAPRTIRFPLEIDRAIAVTAKEKNMSFSALVVEFCGDRLMGNKQSLESRIKHLEQKIIEIKKKLDV